MTRRTTAFVVAVTAAVTLLLGPASGTAPAGAQEPQRYLDRVFDATTTTTGIAYGAAPDENGANQVLLADMYRPTGDTEASRPAVVLAHGGGFVNGNRTNMASYGRALAHRGFVAISIDYRMHEAAGAIGFPPSIPQMERIFQARSDMQAAVRFLRANASTYGIDADKVSVAGSSAGGVMAVLVATMPDQVGTSGSAGYSSAVCTAVSLAGAGEPALVDSGDAGAIFFHGTADTTVPYNQALITEAAMATAGLRSEMVTFPGVGHNLGNGAVIEQRSAEWLHAEMVTRSGSCTGEVEDDPADVAFVKAAYADFLDREPTAGELDSDVGFLSNGGSRGTLLGRLANSDEWIATVVTRFYTDTLGRGPDASGLAYWTGEIRSGRRTVASVAASFYAAPEYLARHSGDLSAWVADLYTTILGRTAQPIDVGYWVGRSQALGRTPVAAQIYGSIESRRTRVTALYQHLLGRAAEPDGLAYWADRVARDGDIALARNLAGTAEYRNRAIARFP